MERDITDELLDRAYSGVGVDRLCERAAAEIERLRRSPRPEPVTEPMPVVASGSGCVTLRDTFAAAALTGLLAQGDDGSFSEESYVRAAYRWADAMLAFRVSRTADTTNHDAAPAARAMHSRDCSGGLSGTGDTPVTEPMPVVDSGSGSVTPVPYSRTDDKRVDYATNRDTTQPRNGTPAEGSVQGEGSFRDSGFAKEPVAWLVKGAEYDTGCEYEYVSLLRESAAEAARSGGGEVVPLYLQPSPTLTDAEREAVRMAMYRCDNPEYANLRGLLERLK